MSNDNIKELIELVKKNTSHPAKNFIEKFIPEETLREQEPQDLLSAACELGCIITKCMNHDFYRAKGVWLKPHEELLNKLKNYKKVSHGYCDSCEEEFLKKNHHYLF